MTSEIKVDTISENTSANGVAVDGVTLKDGGIAATLASTITTADNTTQLTLISTDDDADTGPKLDLTRNSASPAANDILGNIRFLGEDSAGNSLSYIGIFGQLIDPTDGSEDGSLEVDVRLAGTNRSRMISNATETVFNDDSVDLDFRVESNGNANAIFVNGGTDSVTIGAAGTVQTLAGIPFFLSNENSIYTHDVSGTANRADQNTAYGLTAMDAITTGDDNTAVGNGALGALNTGEGNVAVGRNALLAATSPASNTAIGSSAGLAVTTGQAQVFIGAEAGKSLTSAGGNIAIGYQALDAADTEDNNLAIGEAALGVCNGGGEHNVAIGKSSLSALTSGDGAVAIGYQAGIDLTTADRTVFIGYQAGQNVTTGGGSVLIGGNAGNALTTGNSNIVIGDQALVTATTTSDNVAIGRQAGYAVTSAENVLIGDRAGSNAAFSGNANTGVGLFAFFNLTSGANNTAIGASAASAMTTGSNNIMLGHDAGTSNSIAQTTTESNRIIIGDANITDFFCADSSISSSDKRDKADIADFSHGLNFIEQLKPKTYRWDKRVWYCDNYPTAEEMLAATPDGSKKKNKLNIGFMAQDVQAIEEALGYKTDDETNLIFHKNDAMQVSLKYERLIPILVNAVKELSAKVKVLEDA